ncbi:nucleoside hydrolase [Anaerobium acetethylicum]|uniref:Purine nucleosidase/pyrimidine-specific ribonucleoside hydrolase n=1 Tax=Anaerobium acetethylicum TaxID=1619234 RepID=A0A1D3TTH6_9FIRM|nr:nucleoside hydrolase [Anaerobium acetethylicum]SCP97254.1 purine nucleosidase/pyrimidine-specific ribonucleoside hydrolase [Anaerobium acetethylicum]
MDKKKIILDCDPGMDDSMAIVMACKSEKLDVKAITTVNGNYPVEVTYVNARKVLEMVGRTDIPVGKGMGIPMVRDVPKDPFTHGKDGQAENFLPEPKMPLSEKHAVDLIIDTVKENAGDIYLIVTGPMTNIAMAMRKAPEIKDMISGIYAISGAFGLNKYAFANATGDTPQSEWNVYVDPEAAEIVYNSGVKLVALGLDVATHFDVNLTDSDMEALKNSNNKESKFLLQAISFVNGRGFEAYCTVIDCMAVGYAIDPTLVETITGRVGIETEGKLTLGNTVLDSRHHHVWENLPEIEIGAKADCGRFLNLLMDLVLA